jgi:hypothetical protein
MYPTQYSTRGGNQQMKIAKHQSRLVVLVLIASMLLQLMGSVVVFADEPAPAQTEVIDDSRTLNSLDAMEDLMVSTTYAEYLEASVKDGIPDAKGEPIVIDAVDFVNPEEIGEDPADYAAVEIRFDEELGKDVLYTPDVGKVTYKVTVVDEENNPVVGAMVQLCLDACIPALTNSNGVAEFNVVEEEYKVSFVTMPDGYTSDEEAYYFADGSYELTITLKKAA